jgi:hypothetical protein
LHLRAMFVRERNRGPDIPGRRFRSLTFGIGDTKCREAEYAPWGTGKTRPPTHNRIGPRRRAYIRFGIPDIGIEYAVLF